MQHSPPEDQALGRFGGVSVNVVHISFTHQRNKLSTP